MALQEYQKTGEMGEINWTYTFYKYLFFSEEKCTLVWAVIKLTYILFFILLVIHNVVVYIQKQNQNVYTSCIYPEIH